LEKYFEYLEKVNRPDPLQQSGPALEVAQGPPAKSHQCARPSATVPTPLVVPTGPPRCTAIVADRPSPTCIRRDLILYVSSAKAKIFSSSPRPHLTPLLHHRHSRVTGSASPSCALTASHLQPRIAPKPSASSSISVVSASPWTAISGHRPGSSCPTTVWARRRRHKHHPTPAHLYGLHIDTGDHPTGLAPSFPAGRIPPPFTATPVSSPLPSPPPPAPTPKMGSSPASS
jgi:hypothetical protein